MSELTLDDLIKTTIPKFGEHVALVYEDGLYQIVEYDTQTVYGETDLENDPLCVSTDMLITRIISQGIDLQECLLSFHER